MYCNKENVNILTSLLINYGIEHIVVCPGSRNAVLVHNFNECPQLTCHPVTDERSAGFVALGIRQHTNTPVAVCVTSGSALLNLLPATAEATYQKCGIVVISADRPEAWIGQLDGQTMPQQGALGTFVTKSVSLPEPTTDTERWHCRRLVCEAMMENVFNAAHPSVHINVPISEPLFQFSTKALPKCTPVTRIPWNEEVFSNEIIRKITKSKNPVIVIGQLQEDIIPEDYLEEMNKKILVISEQLSTPEQSFTDQILARLNKVNLQEASAKDSKKKNEARPDLVIYMGGNTVSKRLRHYLRSLDSAEHIIVNEEGALTDVSCHTSIIIQGHPSRVFADINGYTFSLKPSPILKEWNRLKKEIRKKHEAFMPEYSQMLAVKLFEEQLEEEEEVYYANSSAVRLGCMYAKGYRHCNRGLNGIEGSLSTAVGASLIIGECYTSNIYCIIGDLSFFYDQNALWQQEISKNLRTMLLNNGEGGIFRNLPGLNDSPAQHTLISACHRTSAEGICKQYNIRYIKAENELSLQAGIAALTSSKSKAPVLLEVMTDAATDSETLKKYYDRMEENV